MILYNTIRLFARETTCAILEETQRRTALCRKTRSSTVIFTAPILPRAASRIFNLGIQLAQLYLSPFDQIIGVIGEAGSGKSVLIKGMFPGLELTNDDDGVNVRPLPILDQDAETGFFPAYLSYGHPL